MTQHRNAIGEDGRLAQVVRHEDRGHSQAAAQRPERLLELGARDRVQRSERLVEQQHAGPPRERARDRDTLPLPARELVRPPLAEHRRIKADQLERGFGLARRVCIPEQPWHESDVPPHTPVRKQAAVLRHVADPPPEYHGIERGRWRSIDEYRSAIRRHHPVERPEKGGLTRSALPDQRETLSGRDLQGDLVEGDDRPVSLRDCRPHEVRRPLQPNVAACGPPAKRSGLPASAATGISRSSAGERSRSR